MVLFIVLHKVPTVSQQSNKTKIDANRWWRQDHSKRRLPFTNRHGAIY